MMKTIIASICATICATALIVATFIIPTAPATAQASGSITCRADSPYAYGLGVSFDGNAACRRALRECAIRTPSYSTCYVTRWWVN